MVELKKLYAAVVGYGNRGQVYADYSKDEPDEFGVAAVIDPSEYKLQEAKERYGLEDNRLFKTFAEFLASGVQCDFVINATMDQYHYETAKEILEAGYDMLLEKPIVGRADQLRELARIAEEKQAKVFVCHVLRYTPFYLAIKQLIQSGRIGKVVTMELNEHVNRAHYLTSFVRGKWNSEEACGSGFLLAKSCHDLDLMCWLNNSTTPKTIASFGSRSQFIPENAPEGATEYCYQCPHEKSCQYSAIDVSLEKNAADFLVWARLNKPLDEITMEEKEEFLKHDIYGKCAYTCGGDIVDRQNAIVNFADGSLCTFNLTSGSVIPGRFIHVVGTLGEIEGNVENDEFVLRTYTRDNLWGNTEKIELHPINNAQYGGHSGGDYMIMHDLVRYLNGDESSLSITSLADSINGHLCVFAAEKARKTMTVVDIDTI